MKHQNYSSFSDEQEQLAETQRRTLWLHEVVVRPELEYGEARMFMDVCVDANVSQNGSSKMEVDGIEIRDMYIIVHGIPDELVLLDADSFETRQPELFALMLKEIETEVLKQAKSAKGDSWDYELV